MKTKDWSSNAGRALLLLMLFALPILSGCTVLGLSLGVFVDNHGAYIEDLPLSSGIREIEPGDTVICMTRETGVVAGSFAGMSEPDYSGALDRVTTFRVLTKGQITEIDTSNIRYLRFVRTPWTATALLGLIGIGLDATIILGFMYLFQF